MMGLLGAYGLGGALALAASGVVIGAIGGLLGIGGGVVAVPVLLAVLEGGTLPPDRLLPVCIGTAHLVVALSAIPAAWGHARGGTLDRTLLRRWTPAVLLGGLAGLVLAGFLPPALSVALFGLLVGLLALRMGLGSGFMLAEAPPAPPLGLLPPLLVGLLSAALGLGAGTLSGPVLGMFRVPLLRAAGAGAVFNLVVAVPAALAFALAPRAPMPDALGQVALGAVLLLALPAMLAAPVAARFSSRLRESLLRRLFAAGLALIALQVLLHAMKG
ncbi:TSUP family transporter [Falsiroseomonas tokyonensis]|uniref:Probable membrane transporter protein n=1 Tax=Falsiroseomonas tokyonensis TaxID=430521 RepID=A0ABV7BUQ6_9PROT|nr:TSUP family transporter [Falsiroseomonas tokyonensis]MBU8539240.1 TSUP family transporter [Falsiroseomonas tokyonensis]